LLRPGWDLNRRYLQIIGFRFTVGGIGSAEDIMKHEHGFAGFFILGMDLTPADELPISECELSDPQGIIDKYAAL
jgi:hypothetical protein